MKTNAKCGKIMYKLSDFVWTEQMELTSKEDDFAIPCVVGFTNHAMYDRIFSRNTERNNIDIIDVLRLIQDKADGILDSRDGTKLCLLREDKKFGVVLIVTQNNNTLFLKVLTAISVRKEIAKDVFIYKDIHFRKDDTII